MSTQTVYVTLNKFTCTHEGCGIVFGIDENVVNSLRKTHKTFYCPNGHGRWFPHKTEEEILREEIENANRLLARERANSDQIKARLVDTEHSLRTHKGHTTRIKKRIQAGVCICCNRTFQDLARHMKTKHPEAK